MAAAGARPVRLLLGNDDVPPHTVARGLRRAELIAHDPAASVRFHRALLDWMVLPAENGFDCWVGERRCATVRSPRPDEETGWRLVFAGAAQDSFLTGPEEVSAATAKGRAQHGPWAPRPRRGEPCWVELFTDDAVRADAFWTDTLNWTSEDASGGATYVAAGKRVANRATRPRTDSPWGWLCYFTVEGIERAAEQVRELGGTLLDRIGHPELGETLVLADPDGAACALTGKTESWGG